MRQALKEAMCNVNITDEIKLILISSAGLQTGADESTLKWYSALQDAANQCAQACDELSRAKDTQVRRPSARCNIYWMLYGDDNYLALMLQTKKLKMELQKAATTPVSQIANISGETNVRNTSRE